jgi:hypothetical protein
MLNFKLNIITFFLLIIVVKEGWGGDEFSVLLDLKNEYLSIFWNFFVCMWWFGHDVETYYQTYNIF